MRNLLILGLPFLAVACANETSLEVEDYVDLEAYQGVWYEVARLPNRFEKNCTGVTATYTIEDDGTVDVFNRCYLGDLDGRLKEANGIARVVDETTNAKLEVSFFRPFFGDYQILMVDEDAYSLVGEPDRKYLWLLARTSNPDEAVVAMLLDEAERQGFAVDELEWTKHQ